MTNLLPPHAKRQIVLEYWVRVVCVWVLLWSGCLLVGSLLLWPTYVLLSGNNQAFAESVSAATERTTEYRDLSQVLTNATKQAQTAVQLSTQNKLSAVMTDLWQVIEQGSIDVSDVSLGKTDGVLHAVAISGVARDRLSLAAFRNRLEQVPYVSNIDLPIENLAQNQNIPFSLQVSIDNDAI